MPFFLFFRERVPAPKEEANIQETADSVASTLHSPPGQSDGTDNADANDGTTKANYSARSLLKSASISASKCIGVQPRKEAEVSLQFFFFLHFLACVLSNFFGLLNKFYRT